MVYCRSLHSSISLKQLGCVQLACNVLFIAAALSSGALKAQNAAPQKAPVIEDGATRGGPIAGTDLSKGIDLTRQGHFKEAIPFLHQAQSKVTNSYAAGFNLALCYLGVGEFKEAIITINRLHSSGYNTAGMNNLLSQAYVGDEQPERAFQAVKDASRQTPKDEKLYAFVADACTDHYAYALGLRVVELGLQELPRSARLHYERAVFLARLDRMEEAKPEFQLAGKLAPGSDLAYLALIQEKMYEAKFPEALSLAREGITAGHRDYQMLSLLGTLLMHIGATPGQPAFLEAREALEASVAAQPAFSTSQIALGKLYLMEGNARGAVVHLEAGRRLEPRNPAVYTSLARAYRELGERDKAEASIAVLSGLLQEKSTSSRSPYP